MSTQRPSGSPGGARAPGFRVRDPTALWMRIGYLAVIAFATIAEPASADRLLVDERLRQALRPELTGRDIVDAARNILLFAGWGAVWVITSPRGRALPMLVRATLSGAAISAAVEGVQLLSANRVASVLDLGTNTFGALAGALALALLVVLAQFKRAARSYVGMPMVLFAAGYGGSTVLESIGPVFRQERLLNAWGPPLERLSQALAQLGEAPFGVVPWLDLVLFAPAGALAVAALAEAGMSRRTAAAWTVLAGAVLYALAEFARGGAGFAMAPGAWLVHVAGLSTGAVLAVGGLPLFTRELRGRDRPAALLVAYASVLALWSLRPFLPELDGRAIAEKLAIGRLVPLVAYRERVDLFTTADVAIPALQFLPLGALLAVWPVRRSGPLSGILPAAYLAVAFETSQIVVSGRYFDVTDILVAIAAAALGFAIVRRAGYTPYGELLLRSPASDRSARGQDTADPARRRTKP